MKLSRTERELLEEIVMINWSHRGIGKCCRDATLYRQASKLVELGLAFWKEWELFPTKQGEKEMNV